MVDTGARVMRTVTGAWVFGANPQGISDGDRPGRLIGGLIRSVEADLIGQYRGPPGGGQQQRAPHGDDIPRGLTAGCEVMNASAGPIVSVTPADAVTDLANQGISIP